MVCSEMLLGFPEYREPARRLATAAGLDYAEVVLHRFPDGETRVRLPPALPDSVVLCCSLDHPDDKLVALLLAAEGARDLGAQRLTLVAPYLCYMRQDRAFHPGEVVSQRVIGGLLAHYFDGLITVDPHLHRVHSLAEAVPLAHPRALSAREPIAAFLRERAPDALLVGPDAESEQWVSAVGRRAGLDWCVGEKIRRGDRDVSIRLHGDFAGRHVVLVDDVASTGRTLEVAARTVLDAGAAVVSAVVTHALFADDAVERLRAAGVREIWSTDSIPHPSNVIALAPLLAAALQE